MADQMYNGDYFLDSAVVIKQEPLAMEGNPLLATASVPIPTRRGFDISDFRDYGFELSNSSSPHLQELTSTLTSGAPTLYQSFSQSAMWGGKTSMDMDTKCEPFHMDDDDIFQVDKADLIQGPTLAELNANDDTLLEDLNFDDLLLPEENSFYINTNSSGSQMRLQTPPVYNSMTPNPVHNNSPSPGMFSSSSFPQSRDYRDGYEASSSPLESTNYSGQQISTPLSPPSHHSSTSSLLHQSVSSVTPPLGQKHSTLHELLLKKGAFSSDRSNLGQSVPGPSSPITHGSSSAHAYGRPSRMTHSSQLSSSAPTHLGLEQVWQRREPRKHLLSTGSLAEAGSTSSLSTGGVLSPEAQDFSHDDGFDTEDDSDHYEDFSSDNDSDPEYHAHQSQSAPKLILSPMNKKERYFWQYNVQAKGPKGQRLVLKTRLEDPHILNEITDPVFSPNCSVRGIKHSGKARKGDGNDLTPNPRKLYNIGKELDKLSRVINDMTPVSELPFNVRPKTRKEKNKLASRACRLKKKAQHEANKLKLYGLEHEHRRLINGISQMKQILAVKLTETSADNQEELNQHIDKVIKSATKIKIAGHSTDYVNKVLDKVKSGLPGGGGFGDFDE